MSLEPQHFERWRGSRDKNGQLCELISFLRIYIYIYIYILFFFHLTDSLEVAKKSSRRSHSVGYIDKSNLPRIEKPIDFETQDVKTPQRKVLKVPQSLRDEISKDRRSPLKLNTSGDASVVSPDLCNVSIESEDLPAQDQQELENMEKNKETPLTKKSGVYNRYEKLQARPLRRSSISTTRKSDKGARRLFVHKTKAHGSKTTSKSTATAKEPGKEIVISADAPRKPPRAFQMTNDPGVAGTPPSTGADDGSVRNKRRRNSKRAMYPPSMAFPDAFLVTKAVDIPLDDDGASPVGDNQGQVTQDLRQCLGETTPKRVGCKLSAAGEVMDPKKPWSTYYKVAVTSDSTSDEGTDS